MSMQVYVELLCVCVASFVVWCLATALYEAFIRYYRGDK